MSPDGYTFAVGALQHNKKLESRLVFFVHDSATLTPVSEPEVPNHDTMSLSYVAWSADGSTLYGSGAGPVFAWGNGGRGPAQVIETTTSATPEGMHARWLAALAGGQVCATGDRGDVAIFNSNGKLATGMSSPTPRFMPAWQDKADPSHGLRLSKDGAVVEWLLKSRPGIWHRLDVAKGSLAISAVSSGDLTDWVVQAPEVELTDWHGLTPRLNGNPLGEGLWHPWSDERKLSEQITAASVGRGGILVSSQEYLRLFDVQGMVVWTVSTGQNFDRWGVRVNQTADGRLGVVACWDGTIRWHRLTDGRELLRAFVATDRRWVLHTGSGYYTASPAGEELIYWKVDMGPDQPAEYYPAERFRYLFRRPDVVALTLETLDEDEALRRAGALKAR